MAVEIKSGNSTDIATVDAISKAVRVTNYASDGHEGLHSFPIPVVTNNATQQGEFVLPSTISDEFKFISMQLIGTWEATVTFQGSNDNTTFYDVATSDPSGVTTGSAVATVNRIIKIPVLFKYTRAIVSTYTSGTISAVAFGHLDENSSGLISSIGEVTLHAETTKVIGTVNIAGGAAPSYQKFISATGLNATLVKDSPAKLTILHIVNSAATLRFFKLYNKTSAPNVGTDIPLITVTLATGASNFALPTFVGIDFSAGLSFAVTLGVADSDTTPFTVVGEVTAMIAYI
jgi:hypothetical protein